jgi:hypothetical protein
MAIKFYKIPLGPEEATPSVIAELKNVGVLPTFTKVYQTANEWFSAHFWGPILNVPSDESKPNKIWGTLPTVSLVKYFRFAKNADGTWQKWNLINTNPATSGQNVVETIVFPEGLNPADRVNMIQVLGQNAQNLFAEYATKIKFIPQLELVVSTAEDSKNFNYSSNEFCQLPLNLIWPMGFVPMFDDNGNPAVVKIEEFVKAVPKPGAQTGGKYTEEQIGAAIRANVSFLNDKQLGKYAKDIVLA